MALPIRTTIDDIQGVCGLLVRKPRGATVAELTQILDSKLLDRRKLAALRCWGFVVSDEGTYRIQEIGREFLKSNEGRREALRAVISENRAYAAIVERALHRNEDATTAADVGAHWHDHFRADAGDSDKILNDQAVCFFRLCEGADFGSLQVGRNNAPTRFVWNLDSIRAHLSLELDVEDEPISTNGDVLAKDEVKAERRVDHAPSESDTESARIRKVFVTHGKNRKFIPSIQKLLSFGELEAVISVERPSVSQPVPDKVMNDMRHCGAGIIHVDQEKVLYDEDGNAEVVVNPNVLIEIGAAMALFGRRFILLVRDGVTLPSNLQGLFEVRYTGDDLDGTATIRLLEAINDIKNHRLPQLKVATIAEV